MYNNDDEDYFKNEEWEDNYPDDDEARDETFNNLEYLDDKDADFYNFIDLIADSIYSNIKTKADYEKGSIRMLLMTKKKEMYIYIVNDDKDQPVKLLQTIIDHLFDDELSLDWNDAVVLLAKAFAGD